MRKLKLKRYFLTEKEREIHEKNILKEMPELSDKILELDDRELEELLGNLKI